MMRGTILTWKYLHICLVYIFFFVHRKMLNMVLSKYNVKGFGFTCYCLEAEGGKQVILFCRDHQT